MRREIEMSSSRRGKVVAGKQFLWPKSRLFGQTGPKLTRRDDCSVTKTPYRFEHEKAMCLSYLEGCEIRFEKSNNDVYAVWWEKSHVDNIPQCT